MDIISIYELNIYGVKVRIRTWSSRGHYISSMFGLFLDNDEGQPAEALDWFDKSDLDLALPLARYGIFGLHSGAFINKRKRGIILPAPAESGKTTLVFSCLKLGYKIAGDDVVLFCRDGSRIQFLPYLGHMFLKTNKGLERYDVIQRHGKEAFCPIHPDVLVFPSITDNEKTNLKVLKDKKEIFPRLLRSVYWAEDKATKEKQASMLNELSILPSYRLLIGKDNKTNPELAIKFLDGL